MAVDFRASVLQYVLSVTNAAFLLLRVLQMKRSDSGFSSLSELDGDEILHTPRTADNIDDDRRRSAEEGIGELPVDARVSAYASSDSDDGAVALPPVARPRGSLRASTSSAASSLTSGSSPRSFMRSNTVTAFVGSPNTRPPPWPNATSNNATTTSAAAVSTPLRRSVSPPLSSRSEFSGGGSASTTRPRAASTVRTSFLSPNDAASTVPPRAATQSIVGNAASAKVRIFFCCCLLSVFVRATAIDAHQQLVSFLLPFVFFLASQLPITLRVRLPDGRFVSKQFDSSLRVDDVIRRMAQVYDANANPTNFRLCLFDKTSTRAYWFLDGRQMLDSAELFGNRTRLNDVSLSLMRAERLDAWTCMNITRALGDCPNWLIDTPEIYSFFGRSPALATPRSTPSSPVKAPTSAALKLSTEAPSTTSTATTSVAPVPRLPPLASLQAQLANAPISPLRRERFALAAAEQRRRSAPNDIVATTLQPLTPIVMSPHAASLVADLTRRSSDTVRATVVSFVRSFQHSPFNVSQRHKTNLSLFVA